MFNLKKGEAAPSLHLFALFFVCSLGNCVGLSLAESLFIRHLGIHEMPMMFLVSAAAMIVISLFLASLGKRLRLKTFVRTLYLVFIVALILLGAAMIVRHAWIWIYPVLFIAAYGSLPVIRAIVLKISEEIFDLRQMKRLFSLISSGAVLGMAAGGFGTALLIQAFHESRYLMVLWIVCIALSFFHSLYILSRFTHPSPQSKSETNWLLDSFSGFSHFRESRLLANLGFLAFLTAFLVVQYDFLYMTLVKDHYQNTEKITQVFGLVRGISTVATFLLQIFLTQYVIGWFGVSKTVALLPILFISGLLTLLSNFGLAAVLVGRYAYYISKEAFFFPTIQPLYGALPGIIQKKAAFLVSGVMASLGSVASGLFLLAFVRSGWMTPRASTIAGAFVSGALLFFAFRLYRVYSRELILKVENSSRKPLDLFEVLESMRGSVPTEVLAVLIKKQDPESTFVALSLIKKNTSQALRSLLAECCLKSRDPGMVKTLLEYFSADPILELIESRDSFLDRPGEIPLHYLHYIRRVLDAGLPEKEIRKGLISALLIGNLHDRPDISILARMFLYEHGTETIQKESGAFLNHLVRDGERTWALYAANILSGCRDDFFLNLALALVERFGGDASRHPSDLHTTLVAFVKMKNPKVVENTLLLLSKKPRLIMSVERALSGLSDAATCGRLEEQLLNQILPGQPAHFRKWGLRMLLSVQKISETAISILFDSLLAEGKSYEWRLMISERIKKSPPELSDTQRDRIESLIQTEINEAFGILSIQAGLDESFLERVQSELEVMLKKRTRLIGNLFALRFPELNLVLLLEGAYGDDQRLKSFSMEGLSSLLPKKWSDYYLVLLDWEPSRAPAIEKKMEVSFIRNDLLGRFLKSDSEWQRALGYHLIRQFDISWEGKFPEPLPGEHPILNELRSVLTPKE